MEFACDAAYSLLWVLLTLVAYFAGGHAMFTAAFALSAVAAWGCLALSREPSPLDVPTTLLAGDELRR